MNIPKIIFIDWYQTLSISHYWEQWRQPAHPQHHLSAQIEGLWHGELSLILPSWMRGGITSETFVKKVARHLAQDYAMVLDAFIESCYRLRFVSDQIFPMVRQLRAQGIIVCIATDNMDCFTRWTVPALGLQSEFDHILSSSFLRYLKEDFAEDGSSLFFDPFLKKLNTEPQQCLLIDDSQTLEAQITRYGINYERVHAGNSLVDILNRLVSR